CMTFAFFYRASLGGPDERREQKFATLVGESFLNVTHKYFTHTFQKRKWKKITLPVMMIKGSANKVSTFVCCLDTLFCWEKGCW
ncbi:hypothetical protein, partial [Geobacillus stearothermophilus]